jgi:hypothetical protein
VELRRRLLNLFDLWQLPFPFTFMGVELLPIFERSRIDMQADLLRDVFRKNPPLSELRGDTDTGPWLQLSSTDLSTGAVVGISADGVIEQRLPCGRETGGDTDQSEQATFTVSKLRDEDASLLVAASGAFPAAFRAVAKHGYILSDGGLSDNLGGCALEARQKYREKQDSVEAKIVRDRWHTDVLIVSDAGAELGEESDISAIGELVRAFDIVYAGSGWRPSAEHILLRPRDLDESLKNLRKGFHDAGTLKDSYTEEEARQLFELGRQMVIARWVDIQDKLNDTVGVPPVE